MYTVLGGYLGRGSNPVMRPTLAPVHARVPPSDHAAKPQSGDNAQEHAPGRHIAPINPRACARQASTTGRAGRDTTNTRPAVRQQRPEGHVAVGTALGSRDTQRHLLACKSANSLGEGRKREVRKASSCLHKTCMHGCASSDQPGGQRSAAHAEGREATIAHS